MLICSETKAEDREHGFRLDFSSLSLGLQTMNRVECGEAASLPGLRTSRDSPIFGCAYRPVRPTSRR